MDNNNNSMILSRTSELPPILLNILKVFASKLYPVEQIWKKIKM
jgi:hypothetical protein